MLCAQAARNVGLASSVMAWRWETRKDIWQESVEETWNDKLMLKHENSIRNLAARIKLANAGGAIYGKRICIAQLCSNYAESKVVVMAKIAKKKIISLEKALEQSKQALEESKTALEAQMQQSREQRVVLEKLLEESLSGSNETALRDLRSEDPGSAVMASPRRRKQAAGTAHENVGIPRRKQLVIPNEDLSLLSPQIHATESAPSAVATSKQTATGKGGMVVLCAKVEVYNLWMDCVFRVVFKEWQLNTARSEAKCHSGCFQEKASNIHVEIESPLPTDCEEYNRNGSQAMVKLGMVFVKILWGALAARVYLWRQNFKAANIVIEKEDDPRQAIPHGSTVIDECPELDNLIGACLVFRPTFDSDWTSGVVSRRYRGKGSYNYCVKYWEDGQCEEVRMLLTNDSYYRRRTVDLAGPTLEAGSNQVAVRLFHLRAVVLNLGKEREKLIVAVADAEAELHFVQSALRTKNIELSDTKQQLTATVQERRLEQRLERRPWLMYLAAT